jgi:uncharacterized protein YdaU (DUF1376 family)
MNAPFFKFFPKDFIASTVVMSAEEVGAYIRLLCYQWENGSVPDDAEKLARIGGCSGNAVESLLNKFCIRSVSGLKNARMEEVRASMIENGEKKRANIAKRWAGVSKKSQNDPEKYKSDTSTIQEEYKPDTNEAGSKIQNAYLSEDRRQIIEERETHACEAGAGPHPTEEQVLRHAAAYMPPIPETFAKSWWAESEGAGWIDRHKRPIHPARWKRAFESAWLNSQHVSQEIAARQRNAPTRQTQREKEAALHRQKGHFGF